MFKKLFSYMKEPVYMIGWFIDLADLEAPRVVFIIAPILVVGLVLYLN